MAARSKSKSAGKAKNTRTARAAAARPADDAARLREVIEALIAARRSGDLKARARAVAELGKLSKSAGSGAVQQAASEARAVADHAVMVDSLRLLGGIAARLA